MQRLTSEVWYDQQVHSGLSKHAAFMLSTLADSVLLLYGRPTKAQVIPDSATAIMVF